MWCIASKLFLWMKLMNYWIDIKHQETCLLFNHGQSDYQAICDAYWKIKSFSLVSKTPLFWMEHNTGQIRIYFIDKIKKLFLITNCQAYCKRMCYSCHAVCILYMSIFSTYFYTQEKKQKVETNILLTVSLGGPFSSDDWVHWHGNWFTPIGNSTANLY
jgi:hypothetical protein